MSVSSRFSDGPLNQNPPEQDSGPLLKRNSDVKRQNAVKRQSLSMPDNYVEIIGKFGPNTNAAQQSAPNGGTYIPTKSVDDIIPDVMEDGTPVVAELRTNVIIKDEFSLLTDLSQHLAAQYTKPASSIMISLQHSTCLTLGGLSDPCYLLNVTAVPSRSYPVDNRRVAQQVQSFLSDVLGVAVERGVILFHPLPLQNVAFHQMQVQRKEPETAQLAKMVRPAQLVDMRRRSGDASWLSLPGDITNDSQSDDDRPLRETLAALQGERAGSIKSLASEKQQRRRTLQVPPSVPRSNTLTVPNEAAMRQQRRKTLQAPPRQAPPAPPANPDPVSWSQLQERRRSLQMPPTLPTIPSPSMMPTDFGVALTGFDDVERPSTSRGRDTNDNKPRLDDRAQTQAFAANGTPANGKPSRPKSIAAESWSYERQNSYSRNRANIGDISLQRPKSSGGERGRQVDWRVSQLLSPPTLHHPRPTSKRSDSGFSQGSKKSRPSSLPSLGFLSSSRGPKSPVFGPQSPTTEQPRYANHNYEGVDIPPVPQMNGTSQRPHERMKKRRSFVTALPQVESMTSIPEVPPIPKMPEVPVENAAEEAPLRKRKSLFKMPFRKQSVKS